MKLRQVLLIAPVVIALAAVLLYPIIFPGEEKTVAQVEEAMRPKARVIVGDCRNVLPRITKKFDLIFADPPFNIGHKYQGFIDRFTDREYWQFTLDWTYACWRKLKPNGLMALHGPDAVCEAYLAAARYHKFDRCRIGWVIWHYRFGQHQDANWINSHCHCLIYARDPYDYTWNPDEVLVESDRSSTYADRRTESSPRKGKRVPLTVWGIPSDGEQWGRVQGNNRERRSGHPNQLPERYLERLIRAYTNEGDYVLDPFCGSGTTPTVAIALRRNALAIEVSEESAKSARERIRRGSTRIKGHDDD